ncbi:peptidoglycan-binding domain-containing protein [Actinoplanes sp. NEAU-A12]|uniref:Peptidoglycan-binding domain-containing protein n=1 Tax=Actinoplanes sandaracinus TaxID=3045177 RepID=A0ABT6X100_9ACTN|nr:peptidoglycan-binding domain-containing protein [Actinoplanes sandaracinus]MDI6105500.1 peptidoglycan-binding domain-containing protein [Actinoplanes sandaracinus]
MSARGMLNLVGNAVGGLIGWSEPVPPAAPEALRELFADLGVRVGPDGAELTETVRYFQTRAGLAADGEAGPRTVHLLARYAAEARELSHIRAA